MNKDIICFKDILNKDVVCVQCHCLFDKSETESCYMSLFIVHKTVKTNYE